MRYSDIVDHLARNLPKFADDFTTNYNVESIERSGEIVTVQLDRNHELSAGCQVNIQGALHSIEISIESVNNIEATLVTSTPHDFTFDSGEENIATLVRSPDDSFDLEIIGIPNRNKIRVMIKTPDELDRLVGNDEIQSDLRLLNGVNPCIGFNGLQRVETASGSSFTFINNDLVSDIAQGQIIAMSSPRIAGIISTNSIEQAYTEQAQDDAFMFVLISDSVVSRNRNIDTDSADNLQASHFFNQRMIQNVQLFAVIPTSHEINATDARDRCEELLRPICRSILRARFPSLIENSNNPLMFTAHGTQLYNGAYYVHQYAFEATLQFGESDVFNPLEDVAFRDITSTMSVDIGDEERNQLTNLDETP